MHFLFAGSVQVEGAALSLLQLFMQFLDPVSIKLLIPHFLPQKFYYLLLLIIKSK